MTIPNRAFSDARFLCGTKKKGLYNLLEYAIMSWYCFGGIAQLGAQAERF